MLERHRHWSVSGVPGTGAQRAGAREEVPRYHGTGEQVQEVDGGQDDERDDDEDATDARQDGKQDNDKDATEARPDMQASLRRSPEAIVDDTWANRPQRTRAPIDKYQAVTKTGAKKPGGGEGDDRENGRIAYAFIAV